MNTGMLASGRAGARMMLGPAMLVSLCLLAGCGGNPPQTVSTTTTTTAPADQSTPMAPAMPAGTTTTQTTHSETTP